MPLVASGANAGQVFNHAQSLRDLGGTCMILRMGGGLSVTEREWGFGYFTYSPPQHWKGLARYRQARQFLKRK